MGRYGSRYVRGGLGLSLLAVVSVPASAGAADAAVICSFSEATIVGTEGPDELVGLPGRDVIAGLGGDDHITGDLTDDVVCGDEGNDTIIAADMFNSYGGPGDDHLELTSGATTSEYAFLYGGEGDDTLLGGPNKSFLTPGPGRDTVVGGADFDTVTYEDSVVPVSVDLQRGVGKGEGRDTITGVEGISGSRYMDRLTGDDGPNRIDDYAFDQRPPFDVIHGRGGDDSFYVWGGTILGGRGDDTISPLWVCCPGFTVDDHFDGGAGYDWIRFDKNQGKVTLDLEAGTATGPVGYDVVLGIEAASGSGRFLGNDADNQFVGSVFADDDWFEGRGGDDTLQGKGDDDILFGGEGDDRLDGGRGTDSLDGGPGADTCLEGESDTGCE